MSAHTTVTSSMKVPIKAQWQCSKCSSVTSSYGHLVVSWGNTFKTYGRGISADEVARDTSDSLKIMWHQLANLIISNPKEHMDQIFLDTPNCEHCSSIEPWYKYRKTHSFLHLFIPVAIILIIIGIFGLADSFSDIESWVLSLIGVGIIIFVIQHDRILMKKIDSKTENHFPYIVFENELLPIERNQRNHYIKTKRQSDENIVEKQDNDSAILENHSSDEMIFCRYCGKIIHADSVFCEFCGNKLH